LEASRAFSSGQWCVILLLVLCLFGCAASVPTPPPPDLQADWGTGLPLPAGLATALPQGKVAALEGSDGILVPARIFNPDGSATPVIMVHGLQSHSGWFVQSAAFIGALGHPVYAIDRRGSGLSRQRRGDSKDFHDWSDDIHDVTRRVLLRHGGSQVLVVGHCFGAIPATIFAEGHPQMVKGLILTTPGIFTHTSIPFSQVLKIIFSAPGKRDYHLPSPLDPSLFSELDEYERFITADGLGLTSVSGDFYWQVHRARSYLLQHDRELNMPLLVAFAGEDPIADNEKTRTWLSRLPSPFRSELRYADARHILEFSQEREAFFADLARWLAWVEER